LTFRANQVTPFLWFNGRISEAVALYSEVFADFTLENSVPSGPDSLMSATVVINGQRLMLFDGGPHFALNPAVSMFISCADQAEVDYYWDALTHNGGEPGRCGWLVDPFGLSWQVIPDSLGRLMSDPTRGEAVRDAMLAMNKIDVAALQAAFDGA
jgi:predicted 3-demethylubiquinone-9 3-methyltransferase (glyoxalase superfamily)